MYILFKQHNLVTSLDDLLDHDVEFQTQAINILAGQGHWTEPILELVNPKIKKRDNTYIDMMREARKLKKAQTNNNKSTI